MAPAVDNRPFVVQVDIYIARRKRMHSVLDPSGRPVFHAPLVIDVLDWLREQDIKQALFTDDETTYLVRFEPSLLNKRPPGD